MAIIAREYFMLRSRQSRRRREGRGGGGKAKAKLLNSVHRKDLEDEYLKTQLLYKISHLEANKLDLFKEMTSSRSRTENV